LLAVSLHGEYPHLNATLGSNGATGKYNTKHFVEMVGLRDPLIPETARQAWVTELKARTKATGTTYQFITYPNATHAFSIKYSPTFLNVLAHIMKVHYKLNVAVVGHNIPGVVEYDPAVSAQSFRTIDGLFAKMLKSDKGDNQGAKPDPKVCDSMRPSIAPLEAVLKTKNVPPAQAKAMLDQICGPMNASSEEVKAVMKHCFPDVMEMCKGHTKSKCSCMGNGSDNEKFCESGKFADLGSCNANKGRCHWGPTENPVCSGQNKQCEEMRGAMAPVVQFAKLQNPPKAFIDSFCKSMNSLSETDLTGMIQCYPKEMTKVKELCFSGKGDGKGDDNKDKPTCESLNSHMAPIRAFTKQTKDTLSDTGRSSFCLGMKSMAKEEMDVMKGCFPDVMKKVMEMCGLKGDGKGDDVKKPANFTYDVGLVYTDKDCKVQAPKDKGWYGMFKLTKPVGVCTTNVIGSSVKFSCDNGVIQEHVYIDASGGKAPKKADCSGPRKYVMPIKNGCNNYNWGSMYMAWKGWCEVRKGDDGKGDGKGDGKDKPENNPICVAAREQLKPFAGLTKEKAMQIPKSQRDGHCGLLKQMPETIMTAVKKCYPDIIKVAMEMCSSGSKDDGKGDGKGDGKSGAGGLRIRSPHATIEMGGDVKLFRAGANALTVDATVNVKGSVSAKSVKIGGVPLDEYIRKMVMAMLAKEKSK